MRSETWLERLDLVCSRLNIELSWAAMRSRCLAICSWRSVACLCFLSRASWRLVEVLTWFCKSAYKHVLAFSSS